MSVLCMRQVTKCRTKVLLGPKYVDWDAAGEGIDSRKRQAARRFAKLKVRPEDDAQRQLPGRALACLA